MGNEASASMYNISRCCASETIEEVRMKDQAMELDYN